MDENFLTKDDPESDLVSTPTSNEILFGAIFGGILILVIFILTKIHFTTNDIRKDFVKTLVKGRIRTGEDPECPLCLGSVNFAVETNCGHVFCGECALNVYAHSPSGPLSPPKCPYCRQRMTLLLPYFTKDERNFQQVGKNDEQIPSEEERPEEENEEEGKSDANSEGVDENSKDKREDEKAEAEKDESQKTRIDLRNRILKEVDEFNRRFSDEPRSFSEILRDIPMLSRHFVRLLFTDDGMTAFFRFRAFFFGFIVLTYALVPFDILPESTLGVVGILDDLFFFTMAMMSITTWVRTLLTGRGGQEQDNYLNMIGHW